MNTTHVCAGPLHIYCTYIYITHICVRPYIYLCAERHIILCFTANEVFYCVRTPVHTHWKIAGRNKFVPHSMSADCSSRGLLVPRPAARALCLARFPWLAHCCCDCWPARYACCCCSAFTLSLCFCARALPISRLRSTRASEAGDKFSLLASFCLSVTWKPNRWEVSPCDTFPRPTVGRIKTCERLKWTVKNGLYQCSPVASLGWSRTRRSVGGAVVCAVEHEIPYS